MTPADPLAEGPSLPPRWPERFSTINPMLQLKVNSSSLGPFKQCPRKYQYEILWGAGDQEAVHLKFGGLLHEALECYEKAKAQGVAHDDNVVAVVKWALLATWDSRMRRPWISGHPEKNRRSLIRTIVWYLDRYRDVEAYSTVIGHDGRPLVECTFDIPLDIVSRTGETFSLIGKLDRVVDVDGKWYVLDTKTTTHSVMNGFFPEKFSPGNQFSLYALVGRMLLAKPIAGIILDGVEVGATYSRFNRIFIPREDPILQEWLDELPYWLDLLDLCAARGQWPQNDTACGNFGGCEHRGVCSLPPRQREFHHQRMQRQGQKNATPTAPTATGPSP